MPVGGPSARSVINRPRSYPQWRETASACFPDMTRGLNYGFLIDNRRCIGCHACSVACKAEHEVPLGVARTWVKYVEKGTFPDTRRTFQVTRCNHCEDAPCIEICPTTALFRRPRRDRGLRRRGAASAARPACRGCPYDALYIDPADGDARPSAASARTRSRSGWSRPASRCARPRPSWRATSTTPSSRIAQLSRPLSPSGAQAREGHAAEGVLHRRRTRPRSCPRPRLRPRDYMWAQAPQARGTRRDGLQRRCRGRARAHLRRARAAPRTRGDGRSRPTSGRSRWPPGAFLVPAARRRWPAGGASPVPNGALLMALLVARPPRARLLVVGPAPAPRGSSGP